MVLPKNQPAFVFKISKLERLPECTQSDSVDNAQLLLMIPPMTWPLRARVRELLPESSRYVYERTTVHSTVTWTALEARNKLTPPWSPLEGTPSVDDGLHKI